MTDRSFRAGDRRPRVSASFVGVLAFALSSAAASPSSALRLEEVASLRGDQPAGIAVSKRGRLFVTFPRHTGTVRFTLGEIVGRRLVPFPNQPANIPSMRDPARTLFSVQTISIDGHDRMWILDTGVLKVGAPPFPGAPKLVVVSLGTGRIVASIPIPPDALVRNSALKDFRLVPALGKRGTVFLTDSAPGAEALIAVDVASRTAVRRLQGAKPFGGDGAPTPIVEGRPLLVREPGRPAEPFEVGLNAIEVGRDGKVLFLGSFTGNRLMTLPAAAAADRSVSDAELSGMLRTIGQKPVAGHFASDSAGRLYAMDIERNGIARLEDDGRFHIVARDSRLVWPDTMTITPGGCLYVTASQYDRGARFHDGRDLRRSPFGVYRIVVRTEGCQLDAVQAAGGRPARPVGARHAAG